MKEKLARLFARLSGRGPLAIAFSGGVDSRFLAFAARQAGAQAQLFHFSGPHVGGDETRRAAAWAQAHGLECICLAVEPLAVAAVRTNARDRCYWCKRALFARLKEEAGGRTVCDGTNADDAKSARPGLAALRELGIASPLAEAGLTKAEVRAAGRLLGLDEPDQPSRPCYLTRFPYDVPVSAERLAWVARLEAQVAQALRAWGRPLQAGRGELAALPDFRARVMRDGRVEIHLDRRGLAGLAQAGELGLGHDAAAAVTAALAAMPPDPLPGLSVGMAWPPRVRLLDGVSGFQDRHPTASPEPSPESEGLA